MYQTNNDNFRSHHCKITVIRYRLEQSTIWGFEDIEDDQKIVAIILGGYFVAVMKKSSLNRSMHLINHGINVHAGANRGKYNDISAVQLMIIELSPLQKIKHGR
jgi:hypothetical protein